MPEHRTGQPPAITIRIDRVRLRLNGADEATVRAALAGLGPELARQLIAQDAALSSITGRAAGTITVPPLPHQGNDAGSLRTATARAITGAILGSGDTTGGTP